MGEHLPCDSDCDEWGWFPTINVDGKYGCLYPRWMKCPRHPMCGKPSPNKRGEHAPKGGDDAPG